MVGRRRIALRGEVEDRDHHLHRVVRRLADGLDVLLVLVIGVGSYLWALRSGYRTEELDDILRHHDEQEKKAAAAASTSTEHPRPEAHTMKPDSTPATVHTSVFPPEGPRA